MDKIYVVERTIYGMLSTHTCIIGCFTAYEQAYNAALKFFNLKGKGTLDVRHEEYSPGNKICELEDDVHVVTIRAYKLDEYGG